MAGRSRFRHGRKRSASGVVSVLKEARTPLERLAGHLESQLATKEAANIEKYPKQEVEFLLFRKKWGDRKQEQVTYRPNSKIVVNYEPPGKRNPRVSHHKGHITISWEGDLIYHRAAWHRRVKSPEKISYEVKVFFKGTVAAPDDWKNVYVDFGGAATSNAQKAWDDLTSNAFVIITRNSANPFKGRALFWGDKMPWRDRLQWLLGLRPRSIFLWLRKIDIETAAYLAGPIGLHSKVTSTSLKPVKHWRWFSFPGVGREPNTQGQYVDQIPGMSKPRYRWQWWNRSTSAGTAMFVDEGECGFAIIRKVYPGRRRNVTYPFFDYIYSQIVALLRLISLLALIIGGPVLLANGLVSLLDGSTSQTRQDDALALETQRQKNRELEAELETKDSENDAQKEALDKTNAQLEDLKTEPRGIDKPPCWYDDQTDKVEFLLEVGISDAGLEIRHASRKAPLRAAWQDEYNSLPFNKKLFGKTISADQFKDEFEAVFKDTDSRPVKCRHFVIVDEGDHATASRYKHDRDAIESRFYIKRPQFGQY